MKKTSLCKGTNICFSKQGLAKFDNRIRKGIIYVHLHVYPIHLLFFPFSNFVTQFTFSPNTLLKVNQPGFPTVHLSLGGTGRMFVAPNQTVFHSNTHAAEVSLNEASITAFSGLTSCTVALPGISVSPVSSF